MNDKLFDKESMKDAIKTIGSAAYTLIYDSNNTPEQITAGKELLQAKWILATISDHAYDYFPVSYFLSDDDKKDYPQYIEWFMAHPKIGIRNAINFAENNFSLLETITRNKYNQHRIPVRDSEKESHVIKTLNEVSDNIDYFVSKLNGPKKTTDPEKPTANEIKSLIETISHVQGTYSRIAEEKGNSQFTIQVLQHNQVLELYKNPLLAAWQLYKYGWHSDFWDEGASMSSYMMFELRAKEMIKDLTKTLEEDSPFASIERNSAITNGLLHVYRHLLKQDFSRL